MKQKYGVYFIPCKVNGLSYDFIFDTGATDVLISEAVAKVLREKGLLSESEIIGIDKYSIANGDIVEGTKIILKSLEIGSVKLFNVNASIVNTVDAPLLLGQSALQKFGKFSVDYNSGTLTLGGDLANEKNISIGTFEQCMVRGYVYYQTGNFDASISEYITAILINPYSAEAYYLRSLSVESSGEHYEAIADLSKAIQLKTNFYEAYIDRGILKSQLGDNTGAISDFTKAIQFNPNDEYAYHGRGSSKQLVEDYYGAISDFTQAILINPSCSVYYMDRAISKGAIKDYNGSIVDYTKAISLDPNNSSYYYFRGLVKYLNDDFNGACIDWNKSAQLGKIDAYDAIKNYCK